MFDIGWGELVVIGIVALIAIGPKELPGVLRSIGQWMGKIRRMSAEFQGQFQEALREAEVADLKKQAEDISGSVSSLTNFDPIGDVQRSMDAAVAPEPEGAAPVADTAPAASAEAESPPPIDVPLPDLPPPVTTADFAPPTTPEPPPVKTAGSGA